MRADTLSLNFVQGLDVGVEYVPDKTEEIDIDRAIFELQNGLTEKMEEEILFARFEPRGDRRHDDRYAVVSTVLDEVGKVDMMLHRNGVTTVCGVTISSPDRSLIFSLNSYRNIVGIGRRVMGAPSSIRIPAIGVEFEIPIGSDSPRIKRTGCLWVEATTQDTQLVTAWIRTNLIGKL